MDQRDRYRQGRRVGLPPFTPRVAVTWTPGSWPQACWLPAFSSRSLYNNAAGFGLIDRPSASQYPCRTDPLTHTRARARAQLPTGFSASLTGFSILYHSLERKEGGVDRGRPRRWGFIGPIMCVCVYVRAMCPYLSYFYLRPGVGDDQIRAGRRNWWFCSRSNYRGSGGGGGGGGGGCGGSPPLSPLAVFLCVRPNWNKEGRKGNNPKK